MSSIASTHGFSWQTLWEAPGNADLRQLRKDPHILYPGDIVQIPKKELGSAVGATQARHRFRRNWVPEFLHIRLLEPDGSPKTGWHYCMMVDAVILKEGFTPETGEVRLPIPPNAGSGKIHLNKGETTEEYAFSLGTLDPIETISGIRARLNHLGFTCGDVDDYSRPAMAGAISAFQRSRNLPVTGQIDDTTRNRLKQEHGF
ncbi:MAG: peptidoglycan-binding protein [Verrucomicrobiales bacterium]|nr:peptidoglycan-binding protein [Verrucomicrobiales bacterium]